MDYVKLEEAMRREASKLLGGAWTRNANNHAYAILLRHLMYLYSEAGDIDMQKWIEQVWKDQYDKYKANGGRARWIEL